MKTNIKIILLASFLASVLASCSAGPIFTAKSEQEAIGRSSSDPRIANLAREHQSTLSDIYRRYERAGVDMCPNGLGFTGLLDESGKKHYYLLVEVRPRNITFGEVETKPETRFSEVVQRHFEKNLRFVRKQDIEAKDIEGLAFGLYWPVRDLSQCDTYGGFVEYILAYVKKADFMNLVEGVEPFSQVINRADVVTSLGLKKPEAVTIIQQ